MISSPAFIDASFGAAFANTSDPGCLDCELILQWTAQNGGSFLFALVASDSSPLIIDFASGLIGSPLRIAALPEPSPTVGLGLGLVFVYTAGRKRRES